MAGETLLQTFFTRLGFETDTKGLDEYKDKIVSLSESLLKLSGVATLSLGGLFEFTRRATEPLAQVAKLSETYSIATDTLAAFGRMGREVGISTEGMQHSIGMLNMRMGEAGIGLGRLVPVLKKYGMEAVDSSGKTKDMRDFLGEVADKMVTLSAQEQVSFARKLGLDPSFVRLLRNGREEFNKMYDDMSKGLPFTAEDYKKAERFQIEFQKARAALGVISSQIALELMPLFQKAMESFLKWWRSNGERVMSRIKYWVDMFVGWGTNVLSFLERVSGASSVLEVLMKALGAAVLVVVGAKLAGWAYAAAEAVTALAGANALATWQIWLIVAAIAVLAGLILLAIDDFEAWKQGGVSVIGTLMDWFDRGGERAKKLKDTLKWVWDQIKSYWEWAKETWAEAFDSMKQTFKAWWPEIKDALILIGVLLGVALIAVVAFGLGVIVLAGKVITWIAKILEWFKLLSDKPEEAITKLSEFLQSILDKVGGWLKAAWGAVDAWMDEQLQKLWNRFANWVAGLWNAFAGWVWDGLGKVESELNAAFADAFKTIGDTIRKVFGDKFMEILNSIDAAISKWLEGWIGKIVGGFQKVKQFFGGAAEAAAPAVAAYKGYEAPPILGGENAVPLTGEQRRAQLSQENVGNTMQNNTFNVNSMAEATEGADKLQQNLKRQQQQLPNLAGPQLVW